MQHIFCNFEQKLSLADISILCKLTSVVIPIPFHHNLIGNFHLGLYNLISNNADYLQIKDSLKSMIVTILQKVEGNQLVLIKPVIGQQYSIRNTGPFPFEKGDQLTIIPPLFTTKHEKILSMGDWELILPLIVPTVVATEINIRLLCIGLLSVHRNYEEIKSAIDELRIIQYRDVTVTLPDMLNDKRSMLNMKHLCIAFSMIAVLSPDIVKTYIQRLSMEDHSMLLIKCQELITQKFMHETESVQINALSIKEELKKIKTVLTMANQINAITTEKTIFLVCDVTADNKLANCIFKC